MSQVWQNDVWIALRTDGQAGAGTPSDPYDGSSPTIFDATLNAVPENSTIHLGPGTFQTRGFREGYGGWRPKSGQRILGAGIDATVIKLVDVKVNNDTQVSKSWAVGTERDLDSFEASDFTVDCNLAGQNIAGYNFPANFPHVACAAVFVQGRNIRLRRIRAINFGTLAQYQECFVLWAGGGAPERLEAANCVIEDCIIEKPSLNNHGIITCAIVAAGEQNDNSGRTAYHRGCAIRNCVFNLEYVDNPVPIDNITFSGSTATVTTKFLHNRTAGQWLVISGALENGAPSTNFNGSFQISNVTASTLQITTPATPGYLPTGEMHIGRYSSIISQIQSISVTPSAPYIVTLTTVTPHNRVLGNNVAVNDVSLPGVLTLNDYNGSYPITAINSPTQLQYEIASHPVGTPSLMAAYLGAPFQAMSADGGIDAIVEGNQVYNCLTGGPYHDSWSTKDIVARNNYFYAVRAGPIQNMGGAGNESPPKAGVSLTHSGLIATFKTNLPHGLRKGQGVGIKFADQNEYNGYFLIESVPGPTQFTYIMNSVPSGDATGGFKFGAL